MSDFQEENNKNIENSELTEDNKNEQNKEKDLLEKLTELQKEIYESWLRDTDKVKEIIETHNFLNEILKKNTMEEIESQIFNNNENHLEYFSNEFSKNVISNLLKQTVVFGENGEDCAFDVLLDYSKIFLKLLTLNDKNIFKFYNILEPIKEIFDNTKDFYNLSNYQYKDKNPNSKKKIEYNKYNEQYLRKKNEILTSELKEGEEIDVLIQDLDYFNYHVWVRGRIISIEEKTFQVKILNKDEPLELNFSSFEYAKKGSFTEDWDWRLNLKEGDIVDCYKRIKYYPATVVERFDSDNELKYKISFRIYVNSVDNIDKYKSFYPNKDIEFDEERNQEFIGENNFYDDVLKMSSIKLKKKDSKIFLNENNSIDDDYCLDDFVDEIDVNGNKTITIGKNNNYKYYFNSLLNAFGNLNGFDIMLDFINNKKFQIENSDNKNYNTITPGNNINNNDINQQNYYNDVILLIFTIFKAAIPYFYKPLLIKYSKELSKTIFKFFDDLSQNDLRNLKKEIIELTSDLLKECTEFLSKDNNNEEFLFLTETFNLNLAIKMLKTSFLGKRTNAIKKISDLIRMNNNENFSAKLLKILKENNIIYEIFGPNNHSQLIRQSKEIIEFLLLENQLSEEELNLIWNATKSGDLDQKKIILKIFNEIFNANQIPNKIIKTLLNSTIGNKSFGNDITDEEIDFIFTLMNKLNDKEIIEKCLNFFINYVKEVPNNNILEKIYEISVNHSEYKKLIVLKALDYIQNEKSLFVGYQLLSLFITNYRFSIDNELNLLLVNNNKLLNIYKKSFEDYFKNKDKINKNEHDKNIKCRIEFFFLLIKKNIWDIEKDSPINFLFNNLVLNKYNDTDEKLFYKEVKKLKNENNKEITENLFNLYLETINNNSNIFSLDGFISFVNVFIEKNDSENLICIKDVSNGIYDFKLCENVSPNDLKGFPELIKLIFENENPDIIKRGNDLINKLYHRNGDKLVDLCLEQINNSNNKINIVLRAISILKKLIYLDEQNGTADVIPHFELMKGEDVIIKFINDNGNDSYNIKMNDNNTIYDMKKKLTQIINYHTDFLKLELKKNDDNNNNYSNYYYNRIEIERKDKGKTLKEMNFKDNNNINEVYYQSNNLEMSIPNKDILDEDKNVIEEVKKIFNEWFDKYSEDNKMYKRNIAEFIKDATKSREDISYDDARVLQLLINSKEEYIERDEFVNWYIEAAKKKKNVVINNIRNMGYRSDFVKFNESYYIENSNKDVMIRYKLGNNINFVLKLFDLMNLENGNLEIFNFLIMLSTNSSIFNDIINLKNSNDDTIDWGFYFYKNKNLYYLYYICFIIEHFIENIYENEIFQNWIYSFIKNNGYKYLIEVFIEEVNVISEINDMNENIHMLTFGLLLKIITQIYSFSENKENNNSYDYNNEEILIYKYLEKENLIDKINENFQNKRMFSSLINVVDKGIEQKNTGLICEIIEIILTNMKNLQDNQIDEAFLNLIIKGLNSNYKEVGEIFNLSIVTLLRINGDLLGKLFEKLSNILIKEEPKNTSHYLLEGFKKLIRIYNSHNLKLNENTILSINEYSEKLTKVINDELSINLNNPKIPDNELLNDISILSVILDNNEEMVNQINEKTDLFDNLLNNIIFNSSNKDQEKEITTDLNNNNNEEEEQKMEFINIDNINNSNNSNRLNNISLQNHCYILTLRLLKHNLINLIKFFTFENTNKKYINNNNYENEIKIKQNYISHFNKRKNGYVGLKNLGCICYMNSTMQQFFMTPTLRYSILRFSDNKKNNNIKLNEIYNRQNEQIDDNMFHQCQKLFSYLLLSQKADYNPFGFTYAFKDIDGNPTKLFEQKDAQEFLAIFLDRLEQASKNTKYKNLIYNIFGIKYCSLITCLSCGKVSYKFDPSVFLSLEVKNMKSLNDSLDKYIHEEYIDGYNCEGCKKNCRISKRNILTSLPNVLIIHLQRIFYNWEIEHNEKINSRLEFPKEINMKNYTIEYLLKEKNKEENIYFRSDEYYNYYLVGVIIHIGSADAGHYYSYINIIREGEGNISYFNPKDKNCLNAWLEFNDSNINEFDIENLKEEAFGGNYDDDNNNYNHFRYMGWNREKNKNAYLLVYERLVKNPNIIFIDKKDINNLSNNNIVEFNEEDENKIFKENDMMRFYNKDNLNEYYNKCNELYNKIFHNLKTDEYFKYVPFYFYKNNRKVPKIYYDEILNDNQLLSKTKDIPQYSEFLNNVISLLEETTIKEIDNINDENAEKIANIFLNYIVENINNKNNVKYLQNGRIRLTQIIEKNSELFKKPILNFLNENDNKIKNLLKFESGENVNEISELINKIQSIYNLDSNDNSN